MGIPHPLLPLLFDVPETLAVRRYFRQRRVLPLRVTWRENAHIYSLYPDWQRRVRRLRDLVNEAATYYEYLGEYHWQKEVG